MNVFGKASFLPEKLNYGLLLELAHLVLKDVINGFQMGKVDVGETKNGTSNMIDEKMKSACMVFDCFILLPSSIAFMEIIKTYETLCTCALFRP
jgi:hypothetical protein